MQAAANARATNAKNHATNGSLVTLNTSVFDVPSQSVETYDDFEGEAGQIFLSTGNNDEFIQAKVIKSKFWLQQREEDDEYEGWGDGHAGFSSEEADQEVDQESAGEDLDCLAMAKYDEGPVASHKSKLNINAPIFLPRNSPNGSLKRTATTHTKQLVLAETDQTAATIKSGQQHIVTDNPIFDAMEQQLNQNDPVIKPTVDRPSIVTIISGQQQIVTTTPTITPAERKLLDAMVSSKPASSLNLTALSTGRVNYSRNKMQSILQHKNKAALVNKQDGNSVVIQEHVQDLQNQVFVGRDTYEEGEEEDKDNE